MRDSHGRFIHLYERECSIQRRNQKLIEIAPSPQLSNDQRNYIGNLAVKAGVGKKTAQIGAQEGAEQFLFLQN